MKRDYTTSVIKEAFANCPRNVTNPALTKDFQAGRFTARRYLYGEKKLYGANVHDVQSWLVVTNRGSASAWILQRLLDLCAEKIIANGGTQAIFQKFLDKETGYDHANRTHSALVE